MTGGIEGPAGRPGRPGGPDHPSVALDVAAIEAVNVAFYDAVERGDLAALSDLWLDGEDADSVSCVHPGWPLIRGRSSVLRAYALIMANTEYIQYFITDTEIRVAGDTALLTCTENVLSGASEEEIAELTGEGNGSEDADELAEGLGGLLDAGGPEEAEGPGPLVGGMAVATTVLRRTDAGWRVWAHHGSPVMVGEDDEGDEPPVEPSGDSL
ncbi:nuclear transport factor 2 family protein [Allostreptomyces psammosilenae]|uniref:Ketosteroid isomerase-like protein n=1 Tax=Allostreptomyces psammosilenae TaxID=1892865 RepID=A0A852ZWQ3_9ACTN|nr:nuclear transport factor 2 family protein [Allostreptomyces psammosilenae]NYI05680.1 ketosteroid isomerase-like protein [Allostreptomyces psammosilenae]